MVVFASYGLVLVQVQVQVQVLEEKSEEKTKPRKSNRSNIGCDEKLKRRKAMKEPARSKTAREGHTKKRKERGQKRQNTQSNFRSEVASQKWQPLHQGPERALEAPRPTN
jgi:hypothetical protein